MQSELIRKAEKAGGSVHKFSTRKTALSQTHLDGTRVKKSLSERVHHDVTGVEMHRDLITAYLSRHVNQDDELSLLDARNGYRGAEPLLLEAWLESLNRKQVGSSESGLIAPERFSDKLEKVNQIADCSQSGQQVNPNFQPESAFISERGVAQ